MRLWRIYVQTKISASVALLQWPRLFGKWTKKYIGENPRGKVLVREFEKKFVQKIKDFNFEKTPGKSAEILWQFWTPNKVLGTPDIIKACINTVEKHKGDLQHILVDIKTIQNYAELPGFIYDLYNSGKMKPAHLADLLRIELLHNHGGIWLDATGYMTAEVPKKIRDLDFFMFHVMRNGKPVVPYMQNCFIRADKNSPLLNGWRELCLVYWKNNDFAVEYFVHQIMFYSMVKKDSEMAKLYAKMPLVDQKETHHYAGRMSAKFDMNEFEKISQTSFFQKLFYKPEGVVTPESNIVKLAEII